MPAPTEQPTSTPPLAAYAAEVLKAQERLAHKGLKTPMREALGLAPDGSLLLKMESFQPTGSFKIRGATHRILALTEEERARGVIAASTGNHGAAVAYAAQQEGVSAEVVIPVPTPEGRAAAIQSRGATVIRHGAECGAAEAHAREISRSSGRVFISPYNDPVVMAGQGTLAAESPHEWDGVERVYVAVGGGGLIGGVSAMLKQSHPGIEIVGCSPAASYPMHASIAAGRGEVVDTPHLETLSIATAGALEPGCVTLEPCNLAVDRWLLVNEPDIARGVHDLISLERVLVEGAVGAALAGWRADQAAWSPKPKKSVVIVCGGNLDTSHLEAVMRTAPKTLG